MEAFSLLNYWIAGAGASAVATMRAAASTPETPEEDDFFDIDFTIPHTFEQEEVEEEKYFSFSITSDEEEEEENFAVATVYSLKPATKLRKFFVKLEEVLITRESSSSMNSKEIVQKYLSKIKPLYVRMSKRYSEKLRFLAEDDLKAEKKKRRNPAVSSRIKVAYRQLRRRKMGVLAAAVDSTAVIEPRRKDDSFIEQQDGIQSAIAHCKRSLN